MSFTGDLEHLPIVDVIQLLHATRKSGILRISCRKGESQLVFKDGFIVSANHLNNSVRIGKILINLGLITPELLDQTLKEQVYKAKNNLFPDNKLQERVLNLVPYLIKYGFEFVDFLYNKVEIEKVDHQLLEIR